MRQQPRAEKKQRKRWIVIGPGIVLALILAVQVLVANRPKPSTPPIIERQTIGSTAAGNLKPAPEVSYILDRRRELRLNDGQIRALTALQSEWRSTSKPLSDDLNRAAGEFNAFMKKAGSKATVKDIQSHAAVVSELSRDVSSLRRVYWEKALQILNKQQRQAVETELSRNYKPGSARPSGGNNL